MRHRKPRGRFLVLPIRKQFALVIPLQRQWTSTLYGSSYGSAPLPPSGGGQWYLDPVNGSDGNSGMSAGSAWLSLNHADAMVGAGPPTGPAPGDTINLLPGTSNVPSNGVSMTHGGTLNGRITYKSTTPLGFVLEGGWSGGAGFFAGRNFNSTGDYITFDGWKVQHTYTDGFALGGVSNIVQNCTIFQCPDPNTTVAQKYLYAGVLSGGGASNLLIQDNEIYGGQGHAVYISNNAASPWIRRNKLHDNGDGAHGGDAIQINGTTQNALIEKNLCYNNWDKQINCQTSGQSGGIVRNNVFYADNASALYHTPYTAGATFGLLNFATGVTNYTLENNVFSYRETNSNGNLKCLTISSGCTGFTLYNNIFVDTQGTGSAMPMQFNAITSVPTGWTADHNCFFSNQTNIYEFTTTGHTFAEWQALGFDANGVNVDPKLVSAVNLKLSGSTPTSVSQGGLNLSASFLDDLLGNTRTVPWTMGAYIVGA